MAGCVTKAYSKMANSVDRRLAALLQHVMPRRQNVQGATDTAGAAPAACSALSAGLRAVILGNTNGGGFGHGLDSLFASTQVAVIAVSDPDPNGRAKAVQAVQRSQLSNPTPPRQHEQWADLVDAHSGDFQLAVVAPRWTTEHYTAGMSVLTAGAHLLLEKPFVHVLAEADEMLALAEAKGLKIAVAHQIRLAPSVLVVKALLPGLLGDLLQIDTWGKMDRRAGGEDLVVLGCHIFDLARFFAGDALWCTARVTESGKDITRDDARRSQDQVGAFAGDEISAQFGMQNNVLLTYTSRGRLLAATKPYSMMFTGTKGKARVKLGFALQWEFCPAGSDDMWEPFPGAPASANTSQEEANGWLVEDWLTSVRAGGSAQPSCSGWNAMKAMEMVMAVFHAGLQRGRVALPLTDRNHPLE